MLSSNGRSSLYTGLNNYYLLNGNSQDLFTNRQPSVDTAVTYTTPKLGSACAAFNGSTSKIDLGSVSKPLTWSMSSWLNPSSGAIGYPTAWFVGLYGGTTAALLVRQDANTSWNLSNATTNLMGIITIPNDAWSHVTITYDGVNARGYVNGALFSGPTAYTITAGTGSSRIGNHGASDSYAYKGLIDEVAMWNRALTAGEVTALYNSGNGTTDYSGSLRTGMIHRWALDGSSVDTMAGNGTDTDMDFPHPKLGSGCGVFTGSSSNIQTNLSTPSGAGARSFSFWYNSLNILNRNLMGYGSYGSAQQFAIKTVGDSVYFDPYGAQYLLGTGTANAWHHVVVTYDGTTVQGYFDNVASTPITITLNTGTTYKLAFGLFAYPPSYQGNLDDIVAWDRALTSGEVGDLWNSGNGIETMSGSLLTNLTHQWHLNGNALDNVGTEHGVATNMTYDPLLGAAMFHSTPNMNVSRQQHTATRLASGKVLVTGGIGSPASPTATCELYDPVAATWTATGPMAQARYDHTAQLLPSGKVLVVSGTEGTTYLATCEIYDPTAGTWSSTGSLTTARIAPTVTLADGKILVAGGQGLAGGLATCEIFDESTGLWTATGSMGRARYYHAIAAMADGNILATGGRFPTTATCEVYNMSAGTWSNVGSMSTGRYYHTMNLLSSGKVLVADGYVGGAVAELYNPTTQTFSTTGRLGASRNRGVSTTLSTGGVLITGGIGVLSAEIYTPSTNGWKMTENMPTTRYLHTSTLLTNGSVLVAGGYFGGGAIPAAEIYTPGVSALLGAYATFNGSTSKIQTSYLGPSGAAPRSLSVWLKPSATQTKRVCGYGAAVAGQAFQAYLTGGNIYIDIHGTTYAFGACSSGVWHHFVATYDGTTLRGYVDGVAGTPVTVTLATAATGPFLMGGGPSGTGYSGSLDDVALYTRALVPAEVAKLYNAGVGNSPPF